MSDDAARAALSRMNMREVAVAVHGNTLMSDLRQLAGTVPAEAQAAYHARKGEVCAAYGLPVASQEKPFPFAQGVAIIPVTGSLINRFGWSYGSVTGYNFIRSMALQAEADPDVTGIVFDLNSYGGEAAGCFELARDLRTMISKPTLGVIDSNCYSACYAIGSALDRLVCTPSGGAGSIGVVSMHVDMSKALGKAGYSIEFIYSGDHKVDGNPYEPLPPAVRKQMQAGVDKSRAAFVGLVAEMRGIDTKVVHDTQAEIYRAEDALALGLIDAISSPSEAVGAFLVELSGSQPQPSSKDTMSTTATAPAAAAQPDQAALASATAEGRTSERARISSIMSCDEAKGREPLANHLAMNTDMSADAAKGILAVSPKAAAEAPATAAAAPAAQPDRFAAAMNAANHPNVGADGGAGAAGGEQLTPAQRAIRDWSMATGAKIN